MGSSAIRSSPPAEALLERARTRLLQDLPAELAQLAPEVLEAELRLVLEPPSDVPVADFRPASRVLRQLLIDELRARLIDEWEHVAASAQEVRTALQHLEAGRVACRPRDLEAFAAELAGQGGFNLMVEVAHDMRSPLTSILFLSEILHKGQSGPLNDVQRHQVGIIYSAALGLENIASDLIEVARAGGHAGAVSTVPFSVNDIMEAVLNLVRPMALEKGLTISRVLLNLCTNALKFTQEGGVTMGARALGANRVEFTVSDTGPGIAPEAVASLFHPFRRAPSRASGYIFSGTGLGLAICRRLVAAMGSDLRFDTAESGTRFWFVIELPPAELL
jgi:signal transduction histidine kinase